jgi:hypothetical protein
MYLSFTHYCIAHCTSGILFHSLPMLCHYLCFLMHPVAVWPCGTAQGVLHFHLSLLVMHLKHNNMWVALLVDVPVSFACLPVNPERYWPLCHIFWLRWFPFVHFVPCAWSVQCYLEHDLEATYCVSFALPDSAHTLSIWYCKNALLWVSPVVTMYHSFCMYAQH